MKKVKPFSVIITLIFIVAGVFAVIKVKNIPQSNPVADFSEISLEYTQDTGESLTAQSDVASSDFSEAIERIVALDKTLDADMLSYCGENFGAEVLDSVEKALGDGTYKSGLWYTLTGNTLLVLNDLSSGAVTKNPNITVIDSTREDGSIELGFVGDINLDDNWSLMQHYKKVGSLEKCISPELISVMNDADVMFANNEFTFSNGGTAQADKSYTFRSNPKNVSLLGDLGIDIVSTANNHIYDYGTTAFADTLSTLDGAGIAHVGSGKNLKEASAASYFIVNGRKIAFVSAGETYSQYMTPAATANSEGILPVQTKAEAVNAIKTAAKNSDYVVVYAHWGYENLSWYSDEQVDLGKAFIDAGADAVVGSHAHVLQGMEFYKGKLIAYNLGNFWFNTKTMDSGLLKLTIDKSGKITPKFYPCIQSEGNVTLQKGSAAETIYDFIESHSRDWVISISKDGIITPAD